MSLIPMREYHPNLRINDPAYLLHHIDKLLEIAKAHQNSSSLIYACLDSRIALEYCDLYLILASVKPEERESVLESSKPKNGIDRLNNKHKALKEKYRTFFQILSELLGVSWNQYNFKRSKELQNQLSTYIHSYCMLDSEIAFHSDLMQAVFPLLEQVKAFIQESLNFDGTEYTIIGVEMSSIPSEDRELLNEWKENRLSVEELTEKLSSNIENRTK